MTNKNYWLRRAQASRVSRRRFVGGAAVAGVGAASLGLVGCGDDDDSGKTPAPGGSAAAGASPSAAGSAAPSETPKRGGTYTNAFTGPFAGADPHNSVYGGAGIVPKVYNYLIRTYLAFAPDRGILYDLAESHTKAADSLSFVFKIRADAKIAPNDQSIPERALTAEDAKASWERIMDPKSGSNGYAFASKWVDKVEAVDPTTFKMTMKKPYAWTEANVGNNLIGAIVPKELLASADLKTKPVGAGAFKLTSLAEGDAAKFAANPNYWKKGHPYLDNFVIRAYGDQATWLAAFQSKQVDYYAATNQDEAKQLAGADKKIQYHHDPSISFNSFWMNTKMAPWTDERVRNAVNLATNRQEYIDVIGHGAGEPQGPVPYAYTKYALSKDELKTAQPFDVNKAKTLFEQAGVKDFTFSFPTSSNTADYVNIFVRQMKAAGVTATPQPLDAGTWVAGYYTSKLSASLSLNQQYQTPDAALQWFVTGGITGNNHYDTGFSDPAIDAAVDKAAGTLEEGARQTAYKDVQKLILSKAPPFINFYGLYADLLLAPEVRGFQFNVGSLAYAYEDSYWKA